MIGIVLGLGLGPLADAAVVEREVSFVDAGSAPCGCGALPISLPLFLTQEEAPRHIRQSRSCHRREQSFAHSGVRHALLPPVGDGALLHVGRSSSSLPLFLTQEEAPRRIR